MDRALALKDMGNTKVPLPAPAIPASSGALTVRTSSAVLA